MQLVEVEYYSMNMLCLLAEHSIRQSLANRLVLTFLGSRGPLSLTPFCTDLTFLRFTKLLSPLVSCLPVPLFHFFKLITYLKLLAVTDLTHFRLDLSEIMS